MPKFNVIVTTRTEVLNVDAEDRDEAECKVMDMLETGAVCEGAYDITAHNITENISNITSK